MKITHHLRRENSGLFHTAAEICEEEQRQGHQICIHEPSLDEPTLDDFPNELPDVHCVHSQFHMGAYHDGIPRVMWMHGEPLGSVGNGISMRAITDLAPLMDAFICMRKEEWPVWNAIKRTYVVPKGIDLNRFIPLDPAPPKLTGDPAILYYENWRGQRNPLTLCIAMLEVVKKLPHAKLHLYNCPGGKMGETFQNLIAHCRWATFVKSLMGSETDVNRLLNRADIVVSCLHPLYARGIEAFGAGKAFIGPGYKEACYPYTCDLEPHSMANAIIRAHEEQGKLNFRQWAVAHHNVADTVKASVDVYRRYL